MMTTAKFGGMIAAALLGVMSLVAPARARDATSNAVHQSFLAMQSVRSYRIKTVTHQSARGSTDVASISELTQSPQRMHTFLTIGSERAEQVIAGEALYLRVGHGSWQRVAMPGQAAPAWGSVWAKRDDPRAVYRLARRDVLNAMSVSIYVADQAQPFRHTETEIWIGDQDHFPYKIIRRMSGRGNTMTIVTEILSDFNAPITIILP